MTPAFQFPAPVLSVDADVVRALEGGEALTGLWTLFTKCKASLEDGHRLENISWRLWHRELAVTTPRHGRISVSEHDVDGNLLVDTKTVLGNEQGDNHPEMDQIPSTHVPLPPYPIPTSTPHPRTKSPTVATVGSPSTRCNNNFGKIIVDMLPNPMPPTTLHSCKESTQNGSSPLPSSYFTLNQSSAPALVADTHSLPIHCSLPTPTASEQHLMPPSALPAQTSPEPVAQVQVQIDLAPPSTPPSTLPRLVVVHPTPGPTPHPTPPASPILGLATTSGYPKPIKAASTMAASTVAAATFPSPKFTLQADGSTTSSSSDSSSTSGRTNTSSLSATITSTDSRITVAAVPQQTKPATAALINLANGNGVSLAAIAAPPPPPSGSASSICQPSPTPAPLVRKAHSSPIARLSPTLASDLEPSRARPKAPGNLRQTSSAGSSSKGQSKSRSRSRGRGPDGAARAGLMMTSVGGKKNHSMTGGAQRGRAVGLRKGASGRVGAGRLIAREKRPTFNIGSHSDDVGYKSAGSGSSVSNPMNGTQQVKETKKEKQSTLAPPQRQQSVSRMPPPLRHPLPDPATVLPSKRQQSKIVLATSDSDDYETETDVTESDSEHGEGGLQRVVENEGDTADWSSEDMSADDVEFIRTQPASGQGKRGYVQPQPRSNSAANITAAHHNHNNHNTTTTHNRQRPAHLSRVQQSRRTHAANAQYVVEQAALEAERLRDMFAKKPVPSSEDLAKQRTRSVGLLTQLMHPNPEIFPPTHPYRRGHSSGDVKGTRGHMSFGVGLAMTSTSTSGSVKGNAAGTRTALGQGQASTKKQDVLPPQRRASAGPAPGMKLSKSVAATPVASQVQVGSVSGVSREPIQENAVAGGSGKSRSVSGTRGAVNVVYRPKGRPADQEMEDTESEGESGDTTNGILVSKSVAQEKLKALAARKGIVTNDRKEQRENAMPKEKESEIQRKGECITSLGEYHSSHSEMPISRPQQAPTPTPIPLGHPYNLPLAAPPSTPRTTRRLMLQTEMSESLRRNLLWERQVSKVNRIRRSSSGGVSGKTGGTVLGGGPLRPLTALPSMVQLTAKQSRSGSGSGSNTSPRASEREQTGTGVVQSEQEREERKKRALARNQSWANEFHYTGW